MFDEPTAGMSLDEVPVILDLIDEIKLEGDKTVLVVEHRMDVIKRLADRIVVLQDGAMIADGPPAEVVALPAVQQAYLGMQMGAKPQRETGHG
jgi:branched-chain amino acid transport system ATP-binding protein